MSFSFLLIIILSRFMLCRIICCVLEVEQNLYRSDAVSARDLIFLLTSEVYVQVRVVISRAGL